MAERNIHYKSSEGLIRRSRGAFLVQHSPTIAYFCDIGKATTDMLPDEILLEIFELYIAELVDEEGWEILLHVCRRWRHVTFAAPRRLQLQIVCTAKTQARTMLDVWPALPILIRVVDLDDEYLGNVVAAVEHSDRISEIFIGGVTEYTLERIAAVMERPFPKMSDFFLASFGEIVTGLPDLFLGGSAPRLRSLMLEGIPFPALPNLLLTSTNLFRLRLQDIPASGYIPLEAMVNCLSLMTKLEELEIEYRSSHPLFDRTRRRLPPSRETRPVLPLLNKISLRGVAEYLEGILASIRAPLHDYVHIEFLSPGIFDVSRVSMFIDRTNPFDGLDQAHMNFKRHFVDVTLASQTGATGGMSLQLSIRCIGSVWQLQRLSWTHGRFTPPFDDLEPFDLREVPNRLSPLWTDGMENPTGSWLELLRNFVAVETLYLSEGLALCVAPALKGLTQDDVNGVLPALQTLFVEGLTPSGPVQVAIEEFVAARERAGHPVDVQCWVRESGPDQLFSEFLALFG
jgi:hypothetical protein